MKFTREIVKPKYEIGSKVKVRWGDKARFGEVMSIEMLLRKNTQEIKYHISWGVSIDWIHEDSILGTFTMDGQDE